MTHSGALDGVRNLDEKLFILGRIFAAHKHLDRKTAALHLVEIFCYPAVSIEFAVALIRARAPFFWVVRM